MANNILNNLFGSLMGGAGGSQNIAAQVGTGAPIDGGDTALATGKGFDQDQIAKLKDVCGVHLEAHIPTIWAVI